MDFIIRAISPNEAVEIELNPLPASEALRRVISMRDEAFRDIYLVEVGTGEEVEAEQFMRNPPHA